MAEQEIHNAKLKSLKKKMYLDDDVDVHCPLMELIIFDRMGLHHQFNRTEREQSRICLAGSDTSSANVCDVPLKRPIKPSKSKWF